MKTELIESKKAANEKAKVPKARYRGSLLPGNMIAKSR